MQQNRSLNGEKSLSSYDKYLRNKKIREDKNKLIDKLATQKK
jgi:hypothetical protein|tara:strand:- start:70 stop:195 length:126 start_codon:yes stop_codon:yes gene_type:complete